MTPGCAFDLELDNWEITGSGDEENTETSHAEMNAIGRQVGNCRGARRKELMVKNFALNSVSCISEGVRDITVKSSLPKRGKRNNVNSASNSRAVIDLDDEDEDDLVLNDEDLSEKYQRMNENDLLRGPSDTEHELFDFFSEKDTKIRCCVKCQKAFVGQNAFEIHCQNAHKNIAQEADGPQNPTLMKQALGLK